MKHSKAMPRRNHNGKYVTAPLKMSKKLHFLGAAGRKCGGSWFRACEGAWDGVGAAFLEGSGKVGFSLDWVQISDWVS